MRRITLKDIGLALNKSAATVSKALSNSSEISEETKKMVLDYANKHNFRFNTLARTLRKGNSRLIGLILPYINTPFFSELLGQIENHMSLYGYNLLVVQSGENGEKELECIESCLMKGVDGLIISSMGHSSSFTCLKRLSDERFPIVNIANIQQCTDATVVDASWGDLQQAKVSRLVEETCSVVLDRFDQLLTV